MELKKNLDIGNLETYQINKDILNLIKDMFSLISYIICFLTFIENIII